MTRNDIFWKGLIEDLFSYFIPFFLPQHHHLFNLSRPVEFLDKELDEISPGTGIDTEVKFVDKLVKVFAVNGEEKWILIHIEVQGYRDTHFEKRMFTYFDRIFHRYDMPVTAIAILTDNQPSFHPHQFVYSYAGTELAYRFNTYKVLAQDEVQLAQSDNPFAIAILTVLLALKTKKLPDNNLLNLKIELVRQLYAKGFTPKTTRQLFNFIRLYVNFAKPETALTFEKAVQPLTEKYQTMGLEEQILQWTEQKGRKEGRNEEQLEQKSFFVKNLLLSTDFSAEKIAALAGVAVSFVAEIKTQMGQTG